MLKILGQISLNISFLIYVLLYLPQVLHNLRRHSVDGLSFLMHIFLVIAYIADVMYGFGRHMQWQYQMVSVVGLLCLVVQHVQFGCYQQISAFYLTVTAFLMVSLSFALYAIILAQFPVSVYIAAGNVAWLTGVIYTMPQIWKNYRFGSAMGVSVGFIALDILSSSCDVVSSWCLNWDYPSKLGSPLEVMFGVFLLWQFLRYKNR